MPASADELDLAGLRLTPGEGRRLELQTGIDSLLLGGESYRVEPERPALRIDVSRMTGGGYALALAFQAALVGPCMRCLKEARPMIQTLAREVDVPGSGEELSSPYVHAEVLDLSSWARDAFLLDAPVAVLCREDCKGLCPVCAADLNEAGSDHHHEREPDPRWAKLRELRLE